jgi:hypothetical protein
MRAIVATAPHHHRAILPPPKGRQEITMHRVYPLLIAGVVASLSFSCPGCGNLHQVNVDKDLSPCWEWNGSLEAPTFKPSLNVTGGNFVCHSFITDGQIRFEADSTQRAGETLDLVAFEPAAEVVAFLTGGGQTTAPPPDETPTGKLPDAFQANTIAALPIAPAEIDTREAIGRANGDLRRTAMAVVAQCDALGQALGYEKPEHAERAIDGLSAAVERVMLDFGALAKVAKKA